MKFSKTLTAALAGCLLCATPVLAGTVTVEYTINFEGDFYDGGGGNDLLPSITAFEATTIDPTVGSTSVSGSIGVVSNKTNNSDATDQAWLFDTDNPTGGDSDLGSPFYNAANRSSDPTAANLTGRSDFGDALIIQENVGTAPDDEGKGGVVTFEFIDAVTLKSLDLLDSSADMDNGNLVGNVNFKVVDTLGNEFLSNNLFDSDSNGNPNWYETVLFLDQFGAQGIEGVKTLIVDMTGVSGAIDNIVVSRTLGDNTAVPIPAAAWLFASALGLFGYLGKRKSKA